MTPRSPYPPLHIIRGPHNTPPGFGVRALQRRFPHSSAKPENSPARRDLALLPWTFGFRSRRPSPPAPQFGRPEVGGLSLRDPGWREHNRQPRRCWRYPPRTSPEGSANLRQDLDCVRACRAGASGVGGSAPLSQSSGEPEHSMRFAKFALRSSTFGFRLRRPSPPAPVSTPFHIFPLCSGDRNGGSE